jgi:hypothetical protein
MPPYRLRAPIGLAAVISFDATPQATLIKSSDIPHHPVDPVPGMPRRHRRFNWGWERNQAFVRPVSAHRGRRHCSTVGGVTLAAPQKGTIYIAGSERALLNEIVARFSEGGGRPA